MIPDPLNNIPEPAPPEPRADAQRPTLWLGVKLAFFGRVALDQLHGSWGQLIGLLLLSAALPLAVQIALIGSEGEFIPQGLPGALFIFPVVLIAACTLTAFARRPDKTVALICALLAANIVIDAIALAIPLSLEEIPALAEFSESEFINRYLPVMWLGIATAAIALRLPELQWRQRPGAAVLALLLIALPLVAIWPNRTLWFYSLDAGAEGGEYADYYAAADEAVLYLQPRLLEQELGRLAPGGNGVADLYFVGVAGDSEQDVFMRELESIRQLLGERFAAAERSAVLINNRDTLRSWPLASATALRETLKRVGAAMDREQDILFLYFTSHGSEDHQLSLQFPPLELRDLDAPTLRQMLDESGIKWRVLVVSACYSGGFIEPLTNDDTLIITAAAADRTSFGCDNENDFTYFGKAYFDEALRSTFSFTQAFELAKVKIAERERAQGYELSNPQIAIGANIQAQLAAFEQRLHAPR